MKSLLIAWKDFKIRFTDRKGFLSMILMPLILTAILGAALSSVMTGDGSFSETNVGIYLPDEDPIANTLRTEILPSLNFIKIIDVKGENELKKLVESGKVDVGLHIPESWSAEIENGVLKEVSLFSQSDKPLKASVMESIVQSYSERVLILSNSANMILTDLTQSEAVMTGQLDMEQVAASFMAELMETGTARVEVQEEAVGTKFVSSMQYYAAAMAVMFLLYNATMGAKSILQERSSETLSRLMMTPTSNRSIVLGKFYGTLLFALIQMVIFYTATTLVFRVDWGDNLLQIVSVGIAYSVAVSGLSMFIAAVVTEAKTTDMISGVGIQIFAILGGSMLPIYLFPDTLQTVANITPNKWALTSFLKIMSGTTWLELLLPLTVLMLTGLLTLVLGTWRLRLR